MTPDDLPLSRGEWSMLFDVLNSMTNLHLVEGEKPRGTILTNVHDAIGLTQTDEAHDVDGPALLAKLAAMTDEELQVIWSANVGFWLAPQNGRIPGGDG